MQPKEDLKILNSREKKEIVRIINSQWDADFSPDVLLQSDKGKVYVMSRGLGDIDIKDMRVDKVGLYIARVTDGEARLTIEGSQLIGHLARKNVLDIDEKTLKSWFRGEDLDMSCGVDGYLILRHNSDFVGCGKATPKKILNFVPKARRAELIS